MALPFTGEYFVPGSAPRRIEEDHVQRYLFASAYARGKRVLDIACGVGYGSRLLADAGALTVDGVDIQPAVIAYASEHYAAPAIRFQVGDITEFCGSYPYDLIVCFETIEHVPDFRRALGQLYQQLAEGGTLIISSPNRIVTSPTARTLEDRPVNRFHVREFTPAELADELIKAGFVMPGDVLYGQRQQVPITNRYLRKLYHLVFHPDTRTSPAVQPVRRLAPRYFVLVATRPAPGAW